MSTELIAVKGEDFTGMATLDDSVLGATLRGNADYAALDAVKALLTGLHAEALRVKSTVVRVDLRQLEFMNSSCFKCFVSWINDVQELPEAAQYKVTFVSNPQLHWQKRSLHSLQCFATSLITIEA